MEHVMVPILWSIPSLVVDNREPFSPKYLTKVSILGEIDYF